MMKNLTWEIPDKKVFKLKRKKNIKGFVVATCSLNQEHASKCWSLTMMMMIARGHQRMINQCGLFLCTTHIIGKIHQASRWWSIVTILFKLTHTQIITRWLLTVTRRVSPVVRVMLQQSRIFGNWHMAIPNQVYFAMQYYYTIWYLTNQPTDFTHFTRCIFDI